MVGRFVCVVMFAACTAVGQPCCSWSGCEQCDPTTDYCNANKAQCEVCDGGWWCLSVTNPGSGGSGSGGSLHSGYNTQSVCSAGAGTSPVAYACVDWNVGSSAMEAAASAAGLSSTHFFGVGSYGTGPANMGKCYEVFISGVAKKGLFQVVNEGGDVAGNQFDLQMGGGGFGIFNGCASPTSQGAAALYPGEASAWGAQYGGWANRPECDNLPQFPSKLAMGLRSADRDLRHLCRQGFDFGVRLANGANPTIQSLQRVSCPDTLVAMTGLNRTDNGASETHRLGTLTRMMDCCKPSAGWANNVANADPNHPAVIPCTDDGFTRINVGSQQPTNYPTSPSGTTPSVTFLPSTATPTLPPSDSPSINNSPSSMPSQALCPTSSPSQETGRTNSPAIISAMPTSLPSVSPTEELKLGNSGSGNDAGGGESTATVVGAVVGTLAGLAVVGGVVGYLCYNDGGVSNAPQRVENSNSNMLSSTNSGASGGALMAKV